MSERERAEYIAASANRERGALGWHDCPECLNRGYFHRVDKNGKMYTEECGCMAIRKSKRAIERSGLSDLLSRYTMDGWQTEEPWQRRAKDLALEYVKARRGWFVMAGSVGAGKTHLCTALCGLLLEDGVPVRYALWRDVAARAKAVVNDAEEYQRVVGPLKRVPVLYVDDLFKTGKGQEPTTADVNLAFEILNYRYNNSDQMTVISTERSIDEILSIDEAVGSRIYERAKGFYLPLERKENWRLRQ